MPIHGSRKFQTKFRALSDTTIGETTIGEKLEAAKLGPSHGMALLWCAEHSIDLALPFHSLKKSDITSMASIVGLKPLEQERLERVFWGEPHSQLPQLSSRP